MLNPSRDNYARQAVSYRGGEGGERETRDLGSELRLSDYQEGERKEGPSYLFFKRGNTKNKASCKLLQAYHGSLSLHRSLLLCSFCRAPDEMNVGKRDLNRSLTPPPPTPIIPSVGNDNGARYATFHVLCTRRCQDRASSAYASMMTHAPVFLL